MIHEFNSTDTSDVFLQRETYLRAGVAFPHRLAKNRTARDFIRHPCHSQLELGPVLNQGRTIQEPAWLDRIREVMA